MKEKTPKIPRMHNGFYEVYDPQTDIYHEFGNKQAAAKFQESLNDVKN